MIQADPSDARDAEDAEGRTPEAGRDRGARRVGAARARLARLRATARRRASLRTPRQPRAAGTPVRCGVRIARYVITPEQRAFWSFQPLRTPPVPAVSHASWPKTDIDRFVLARLETARASRRCAPADKRTLIRRATLDLTGLPPTPEEIDAFEKDDSPDAFAKVVDRLLASPRYGETWGRLWLDVARYGEDDYRSLDPKQRGYNPYPNAYLYRDWVIKAFNDDLPYDQFVRAQLAGDLLGEPATRARTLPALGFLGLGPWYYDNGAVEITRADERHDRVDVVSRGFLGLTVGCARCHDHKYDPIPTRDYYSLAGVFLNTSYHEYPLVPKSVVDDYTLQDKQIEKKEKLLDEFTRTESTQLAETLALQASSYMAAAWKVTRRAEGETSRRSSTPRSSTTSCSIAGSSSWRSRRVLSVPDQVAGDDQGRRQRRRGEEARRRVPGAAARRDVRPQGDQGRERHHRREGADRARRRRSRASCRATSSPTTTSVPAAGSS